MNEQEYLNSIGINLTGYPSDDNSFVVDLDNSEQFGIIYSILEDSDDLDIMYDNQVITEQGSSLIYESLSQPFLLNLIADFEGDKYSLIINEIK